MHARAMVEGGARLATGLGAAIAVLALGVALVALVAPRLAGVEPTIVLSGSMEPSLRAGGLAFVRPLDEGAPIEAGEIITFRAPRDPLRLVSHRVTGVIGEGDARRFATRGDASAEPDPVLVPVENVVGTVVFHLPRAGGWIQWLRRPAAFLALIGVPTALVVLEEARRIARDVRQNRRPSRAELHRALQELARVPHVPSRAA